MSKNKKTTATVAAPSNTAEFTIRYPLLWLILSVIIVYAGSLNFGLTELDDSIFIRELHSFNEDISNLFVAFQRGVFDPTNDTYYRPLFLDSIILNYQVSEQNAVGYHFVNLLLHLASVLLLFQLFKKIGLKETTAFLLTLLFAIHPVLSQAIAWIPGRNDTLLAMFVLPFLLFAIDYTKNGKGSSLVLSSLFLLAAAFTKETGVFAPGAAFIILVFMLQQNWKGKRMLLQYAIWIGMVGIYLVARSQATLKAQAIVPSQMLHDFFFRLPLLVQYLGKILFPFNLSVFPIQQDTSYWFGIAAVLALIIGIITAKEKSVRVMIGGFLIFLVFLLPVLFVPNTINEQTFEHRLYLPIIGMLLVLSQTALFKNRLTDKTTASIVIGIAIIFAAINLIHQQKFKDPLTFWEQAAETSPHSAYALMMYGARIQDKQEGYALMRRAYALNPDEKYLNYYYGVMLQNEDSLAESEKHFLKEQKISDYFECDFYLAQIDFHRKDLNGAQKHLERYLTRDSLNGPANNNLLLLYLQTRQKRQASGQIQAMQHRGIMVPQGIIQQVQALP